MQPATQAEPLSMSSHRPVQSMAFSGKLPDELLVLVMGTLASDPQELYASLICSRICLRWRRVAISTPSLWSLIDTSRGRALTRLWLLNSQNVKLDIRLCDEPVFRIGFRHGLPPRAPCVPLPGYAIACDIIAHVHRWRSLDISYSCVCLTSSLLSFLCGPKPEPLRLDNLTIGPMGKTNLEVDDETHIHSRSPPVGDPTVTRERFKNACIQPTTLRVDTIPVCPSRYQMFSSRLTVFHFVTGNYLAENPNLLEWHTMLSATPNLVELCLWHSRHGNTASLPCQEPISLTSLRRLKLTGLFVQLSGLFTKSPLPNLRHLQLDSLDPDDQIPRQVTAIASVSPDLEELSIGSKMSSSHQVPSMRWAVLLQALPSLNKVTCFEMEWKEIATILGQLGESRIPSIHVRLERIYDLKRDEVAVILEGFTNLFIELEGCIEGADRQCRRSRCDPESNLGTKSELGTDECSNYSDGSSIDYIFEASSEESEVLELSSEWDSTSDEQ